MYIDKRIVEVEKFWGDKMPMMAMEEAGEFIQALSKLERKGSAEAKQNLKEEIRDMYISLGAVITRYDIDSQEIIDMMDEKLNTKKES